MNRGLSVVDEHCSEAEGGRQFEMAPLLIHSDLLKPPPKTHAITPLGLPPIPLVFSYFDTEVRVLNGALLVDGYLGNSPFCSTRIVDPLKTEGKVGR